MNEIIKEIVKKYPNNTWLQMKLAELDIEFAEINQDRNRLVSALSNARNTINRLRAQIDTK
jgi:predicted  nucleic acid-binding Zn-ribbon protein